MLRQAVQQSPRREDDVNEEQHEVWFAMFLMVIEGVVLVIVAVWQSIAEAFDEANEC
jgi:hypothetical protein